VDSSDSLRVKSDRGHHHRGVAPEGASRAATDRAVKDRKHRFTDAQIERIWGNRLSPSSWPFDSQNRWRDRTELESNPPTSQRARRQGNSSLAEPTVQPAGYTTVFEFVCERLNQRLVGAVVRQKGMIMLLLRSTSAETRVSGTHEPVLLLLRTSEI
jgi:hypothetical protein